MAKYEKAEHYERTKPYKKFVPKCETIVSTRFQPKVNDGGATYAKTEYR